MADYKKMFADALMGQQKQQDPAEAQYRAQLQAPMERNIAPTTQLLDNWAGTNATATLPQVETTKQKLAQLLALDQEKRKEKLGGLGQLAKMQSDDQNNAYERQLKERMFGLKMAQARQKMAAGPKLGSEDKKALGFTGTLLRELPKLKALYESDAGTIRPGIIGTLTGKNEIESVAEAIAENYGRLQSGGAISKDEESRFLSRLGTMMDSKEIRLQKLQQIMDEIQDKHNIYGGSAMAQRAPSAGGMDWDSMDDAELAARHAMLKGR
jgi:hypothetical protein